MYYRANVTQSTSGIEWSTPYLEMRLLITGLTIREFHKAHVPPPAFFNVIKNMMPVLERPTCLKTYADDMLVYLTSKKVDLGSEKIPLTPQQVP